MRVRNTKTSWRPQGSTSIGWAGGLINDTCPVLHLSFPRSCRFKWRRPSTRNMPIHTGNLEVGKMIKPIILK